MRAKKRRGEWCKRWCCLLELRRDGLAQGSRSSCTRQLVFLRQCAAGERVAPGERVVDPDRTPGLGFGWPEICVEPRSSGSSPCCCLRRLQSATLSFCFWGRVSGQGGAGRGCRAEGRRGIGSQGERKGTQPVAVASLSCAITPRSVARVPIRPTGQVLALCTSPQDVSASAHVCPLPCLLRARRVHATLLRERRCQQCKHMHVHKRTCMPHAPLSMAQLQHACTCMRHALQHHQTRTCA